MYYMLKELCHDTFAVFRPKLYRIPSFQPLPKLKTLSQFLQEEWCIIQFYFCLKDGYEKWMLIFWKFNPSQFAIYNNGEHSQCSRSVFSEQTSSPFLSFRWCEDIFQHSKLGQNRVTEPLLIEMNWCQWVSPSCPQVLNVLSCCTWIFTMSGRALCFHVTLNASLLE